MKRLQFIAIAVTCTLMSCNTSTQKVDSDTGDTEKNSAVYVSSKSASALSLHEAVLPIVDEYSATDLKCQDCGNVLLGKKDESGITFFLNLKGEYKEWIKIFTSGDSLFELNIENKRIIIDHRSSAKEVVDILPALSEVMNPLIGGDYVMDMISPFFNSETSTLYLAELAKAEKKVGEIMFMGKPDIDNHMSSRRSFKNGYSFDYYGPGRWTLNKGIDVSIDGPFAMTDIYTSSARISYSIPGDGNTIYSCGLFDCNKAVQTKDGWVYTPISVDEFKKNYSSPF